MYLRINIDQLQKSKMLCRVQHLPLTRTSLKRELVTCYFKSLEWDTKLEKSLSNFLRIYLYGFTNYVDLSCYTRLIE